MFNAVTLVELVTVPQEACKVVNWDLYCWRVFPGQLNFSASQTCSLQQLFPVWNVITKLIQERKKITC